MNGPRKTTVLNYSAQKPPPSIDPRIRGYLFGWLIAIIVITILSLLVYVISQSYTSSAFGI